MILVINELYYRLFDTMKAIGVYLSMKEGLAYEYE